MKTETVKSNFRLFADASRYNSGKHFLDSGGANGRHWQKPPIEEKDFSAVLDVWRTEITGTIETAHFLSNHLNVDRDVQSGFEKWAAEQDKDESWFELSERYAKEVLGLVQRARDNVYNGENDLTQVYIWEVYTPEDDRGDWIFADDALTVIFIHTGCDVRGGYSAPLFCRSNGEYVVPVDVCAEFYVVEARDADGDAIAETYTIDERWRSGWSSWPAGQLRDDVERVFTFTQTKTTVCAKLKSGEIVKIGVNAPGCY